MRNLIYAMICIFTIASCSEPDTDVEVGISDTTSSRAPLGPHNDSNPYDLAGKLHYDILELYIPLESDFATTQSIISLTDSLATNDGRFTSLATGTYSIPISTRINAILSDPEGVYTALSASISPLAITTVKNFCTDVVALYTTNADYDDAYLYITSYEDAIILSGFTSKEKEVMLTIATGVNDLGEQTYVTVYPNPANETVNVSNPFETEVTLKIYNFKGQLLNEKLISSKGNQVSVQNLNPGTYLFVLQSENSRIQNKVVVF